MRGELTADATVLGAGGLADWHAQNPPGGS